MLGQVFHGISAMGAPLDSGEEYSSQTLRKRKDDCEQRVHFLPKFFIFRIHYHSNVSGHLSRLSFLSFLLGNHSLYQECSRLCLHLARIPTAFSGATTTASSRSAKPTLKLFLTSFAASYLKPLWATTSLPSKWLIP